MTLDVIEGTPGREQINHAWVKKTYADLIEGRIHPPPCTCPSCCYSVYTKGSKDRRNKFDKLAFFLSWLKREVQLSLALSTAIFDVSPGSPKAVRLRTEWYRIENKNGLRRIVLSGVAASRFKIQMGVQEKLFQSHRKGEVLRGGRFEWRSLYQEMADYLKKHFNIIMTSNCIKQKLWRFKKSRVHFRAEQARLLEDPEPKKKGATPAPGWGKLPFAQRVGRFIQKQPGKQITQRDLLRHFSDKREGDLAEIQGWYGICIERRGRSTIYSVL